MSTTWVVVIAVVAVLAVLTFAYSVLRLPWRLRKGDVEAAGRDSDTWRQRRSGE